MYRITPQVGRWLLTFNQSGPLSFNQSGPMSSFFPVGASISTLIQTGFESSCASTSDMPSASYADNKLGSGFGVLDAGEQRHRVQQLKNFFDRTVVHLIEVANKFAIGLRSDGM